MREVRRRRPIRSTAPALALPLLLLVLLLPLPSALAAADPVRVYASTYRVDLGALAPGEVREGSFRLHNPNTVEARVALRADRSAWASVAPEVVLAPGEARDVPYAYRVPADAGPGDHGEAILLTRPDAPRESGAANLVASTAIVFTSRTPAVGVASLAAPSFVPPGGRVSGEIGIVNTWNASVAVTVQVEWRNASGALVAERLLNATVDAGAAARAPFVFSSRLGAPGAHTLEARVVETTPAAPIGGGQHAAIALGRREARFSVAAIEDAGDGNASVAVDVENTGDVPTTLRPRVAFRDATGELRVLELDEITLSPGETRRVHAAALLPPGRFGVSVDVDGAQAAAPASDETPLELHMRAPAPARPLEEGGLPSTAAALAAAAAAALALWQRRRIARLVRIRPRRSDDVDALLARLESDLERPATLLIDLGSLDEADVARVRAAARGWAVGAERLYGADRAGLSIAALEEARAGRVVLLATRDPALDPLDGEVARAGGRIERLAPPAGDVDRIG